jgi:flagellar hook-length control protein FliK
MTQPDLIALVGSALSGLGPQAGAEPDPFRAALRLGEIIRGRVMRSLGEGRYAVNFQGHERVVDSTIPLRTEEILHGRVVAVGDRVELQRVRIDAIPPQRAEAPAPPGAQAASGGYAELRGLVASWPAAEQAALARLVAGAPNEDAVLLAARAVARSGLPGSSALVELVYAALAPREGTGMFAPRSDAVVLASTAPADAQAPVAGPAAVAAFAELLKASFDAGRPGAPRLAAKHAPDAVDGDVREPASDGAQHGFGAAPDAGLAAAFFNAQTGGALAHAVGTIPLIVDGRLVELDVAMFGEPRGGAAAMPHGRVVIELDIERLGHLHIDANLVGSHVHVGIASDSADAADFIAQHAPVLRSRIEDDGWSVDGLRYEVRERGGVSGPAKIVLEHRVSADSLSRLI